MKWSRLLSLWKYLGPKSAQGKYQWAMEILAVNGQGAELKAAKLLLQAAEAGSADAQYQVAIRYLKGPHAYLPKDLHQALFWLKQAAHQDHGAAQSCLGCVYLGEPGIEKNASLAVFWLQKSAAFNNSVAQAELGRLYLCGQGVSQDIALGLEFYHKAVAQQQSLALRYLGHYHLGRYHSEHYAGDKYCGQRETPDFPQAQACYQQAAAGGDCEAMFYVAELYRQGLGISKDESQAYYWYQQAALDYRHPLQKHTAYQLGLAYLYGKGVAVNYYDAQQALMHAAISGHPQAAYEYAAMYQTGLGKPHDLEDVYFCACVAILQGYKQATEISIAVGKKLKAADKRSLEKSAVALVREAKLIKIS